MVKSNNKLVRLYRKIHRWPGLIISVVLLYYGITGVFMNHREYFSDIDIARTSLPEHFQYRNWNNGALKGNLIINKDSILVYGNIGVWLTDSTFKDFSSFNSGFPKGMDNRKIFDVHQSKDGNLYAATQFGLFAYDIKQNEWTKFLLDVDIKRFVGVESIGDTIYALNRSYLFKGKSNGYETLFQKIELEEPLGYKKEVGLLETTWQIHSGEIFGLPGKLFVDFLGFVTAFLSITGIIYFFFPDWIKSRKRKSKKTRHLVKVSRWSLKWHNKLGAWTFVALIVLYFTGMFLRPPLLIAIANSKVAPIKYSHLDQPNPWYDKFRGLLYNQNENMLLLSTSEGMYQLSLNNYDPVSFKIQPPISVMGINTFKPHTDGAYMIGSFSGLFLWNPLHTEIYDYAKGEIYKEITSGIPIGDFKITGLISDVNGNQYMIDYDAGAVPLYHDMPFPDMPQNILEESKISLWNVSLEIHTGRFFKGLLGILYILIVPLTSLVSIIVVISGYLLWRKQYKNKK